MIRARKRGVLKCMKNDRNSHDNSFSLKTLSDLYLKITSIFGPYERSPI